MSAGNNIGSGREIIERFKTERNSLGLTDRELIEGLLSANCHGEDAKQCTDKLFVRFGSLTGILEAGRKKLESSGIVGSEAAALLDSAGRCVMSVLDLLFDSVSLSDYEGIKKSVICSFAGDKEEKLRVFPVSSNMKLLPCFVASVGSGRSTEAAGKELLEKLMQLGCKDFFIAHNHVSGKPVPSDSDIRFTRMLNRELREFGVRLLDHFIVAKEGICSLRELGLFFDHE